MKHDQPEFANLEERNRLGQLLRNARQALRLSQAVVAKRVEVTPVYISQLEAGHRTPSDRVAKSLADTLKLPQRELLKRVYTIRSREARDLFGDVPDPCRVPWRSIAETPAMQFLLMQVAELDLSRAQMAILLESWRNDVQLLRLGAQASNVPNEPGNDAAATTA